MQTDSAVVVWSKAVLSTLLGRRKDPGPSINSLHSIHGTFAHVLEPYTTVSSVIASVPHEAKPRACALRRLSQAGA